MKQNISDLKKFKYEILAQAIQDAELEVQNLESDLHAEAGSASAVNEIAEQKARLALSDLKTPLAELKNILGTTFPDQMDDVVTTFSLFDLTVTSEGKSKVITYFVLPLADFGKLRLSVKVGGQAIALTTQRHPWFGRSLNERSRLEPQELWDEPHMGHVIKTGEYSKATTIRISWVYK